MTSLWDMIWIETRKAVRSGMPLWTGLGSLAMPLGVAFLVFVSRNPQISQRLGLISAKANLVAYAATDWPTFLGLSGQILAAGGFLLFILAISWTFGREFADGTVKDLLAVPVPRSSILLAKFVVVALWSALLTIIIFIFSFFMGGLIRLPGGSLEALWRGGILVAISAALALALSFPFALFASAGRGYLLPIGLAILTLILTNIVTLAGWGEYFPWAIAGLYAQGKTSLSSISYALVLLTALAGMAATYLWWKLADQGS